MKSFKKILPRVAYYLFFVFLAGLLFWAQTKINQDLILNLLPALPGGQRQALFATFLTTLFFRLDDYQIQALLPFSLFLLLSLPTIFFFRLKKTRAKKVLKILLDFFLVVFLLTMAFFSAAFWGTLEARKVAQEEIDKLISQIQESQDLSSLGIVVEEERLAEEIGKMTSLPPILGQDNNLSRTILVKVFENQFSRSEFYQRYLLPGAIGEKNFEFNFGQDVFLLPDKTLVITALGKDSTQTLSPVLARLMIQNFFDPRPVKTEPKLEVMDRAEFLNYRDGQINEQLAKIDSSLDNVQQLIEAQKEVVAYSQKMIEENQAAIGRAEEQKNLAYQNCLSAGYFRQGRFYRSYSDQECDLLRKNWEESKAGFQRNVDNWQVSLAENQSFLQALSDSQTFLSTLRQSVASLKDRVPYELGLFVPPETIKVVLESVSEESLADYFALVVHEYLHYGSYVSEERRLPLFFEEGLTEYFSRQIIEREFKTQTNIGYPGLPQIIEEIAQDVSRDELQEIYFTKDENRLIALLNNQYGENFYQSFASYFDLLPWLTLEESLEYLNKIMAAVGGSQLKKEDLIGTPSVFEGTAEGKSGRESR